jgi:hypothetical protein
MAFRTASSEDRCIRTHDFKLLRFTEALSNVYRQSSSLNLKEASEKSHTVYGWDESEHVSAETIKKYIEEQKTR